MKCPKCGSTHIQGFENAYWFLCHDCGYNSPAYNSESKARAAFRKGKTKATISMSVIWYDRGKNFSPDYEKKHMVSFEGETPKDCMEQYRSMKENHDLFKFTIPEIIGIY